MNMDIVMIVAVVMDIISTIVFMMEQMVGIPHIQEEVDQMSLQANGGLVI